MTSRPQFWSSHETMIDVSSPPDYASTTVRTRCAIEAFLLENDFPSGPPAAG
jgi:hypothetical protein